MKTISNIVVYGGRAGPGGVIVVTLKNQDDFNKNFLNSPTPGMRIFSPTGYYKAREFYSPRYDDPKTNQAIADQRSTIYWNPNIVTDKDGNAFFDYFNAGAKGSYRIIVEGMTVDGSMGRKVYRYKVNE